MPANKPKDNTDDEPTIAGDPSAQRTKTIHTQITGSQSDIGSEEDGELTRSSEPTVSAEPTLADIRVEDNGNIVPEVERKIKSFPKRGIRPALLTKNEEDDIPTSKWKYLWVLLMGIGVIGTYSYNKKNSQLKLLVQSYLHPSAKIQTTGDGTLKLIISEPNALVKINGQTVTLIEDQINVPLAQNLQVLVEKEGFNTYENIVQLKDYAPLTLTINLQPAINGKLFYSTIPSSTITLYLGDKEITNEFGEINNRMLAPGKYKIHVKNLNLAVDYSEEIEIQAGKYVRIEKTLSDANKKK